jgi:outer membrane biosynthesis protein TonB
MYKILKTIMFLSLTVMLLLMTGCKGHNQTQPTQETLIDMPDGMNAQLGVENEADWDGNTETDVTVSDQDPSVDIRQDETIPAKPETPTVPETKPQEKPNETPDVQDTKPQEKPNETPDVQDTKPQEKPNETPDVQDTKPEDTEGTENVQTPDAPAPGSLTYQEFYALTPDQQEAYTDSFESLRAFNEWFNKAKDEYESTIPDETVNGSINIGKLNP